VGSEIESDLNVAVVSTDDSDTLVFRRVLDLIDERAVAERSFSQILRRGVISDVPKDRVVRIRVACDRLENACGGSEQMTAAVRAVVAAGDTTVEHVNRQHEGLYIAGPTPLHARPLCARGRAVVNATTEAAAVIT